MGSYFDERLLFGEAVDCGAFAVGDTQIGDSINLGDADPGQLEDGTEIPVHIQIIEENVDSAGDATVSQFVIQADTVANFASPTDVWASGLLAQATLVAGYKLPRVYFANGGQQYVRLVLRITVADWTAGKVTAWIEAGRGAN